MTEPLIHPITSIELPPASEEILPSGMRICRVPGSDVDVVRLRIVWPGGSMDCRCPIIANIASLLIPEASKHFPGNEIARRVDFLGARLNISVMEHFTLLTVTSLSSKLGELLPLLTDIISNPLLEESTFQKMKEIATMRYLTSLEEVDVAASLTLNKMMRGSSHPNSNEPTIEDIAAITIDEVKDFYISTMRTASRTTVFISGKWDDSLDRQIVAMLSSLPNEDAPAPVIVPFVAEPPATVVREMPDALQSGIEMGLPAIDLNHPDAVFLRNSVTALGGYFGSRLMKNIREDKGYTYGISASTWAYDEGSIITISVQTDNSLVDKVISETKLEMARLAEEPPTGDELRRLLQNLGTELAARVDTPFNVADVYMREYIGIVPNGFFKRRSDSLVTTTPEVISTMAARYLKPQDLRIAIAGNIPR